MSKTIHIANDKVQVIGFDLMQIGHAAMLRTDLIKMLRELSDLNVFLAADIADVSEAIFNLEMSVEKLQEVKSMAKESLDRYRNCAGVR